MAYKLPFFPTQRNVAGPSEAGGYRAFLFSKPSKFRDWFQAGYFYNRIKFQPWTVFDTQPSAYLMYFQRLSNQRIEEILQILDNSQKLVTERDDRDEKLITERVLPKFMEAVSDVSKMSSPDFTFVLEKKQILTTEEFLALVNDEPSQKTPRNSMEFCVDFALYPNGVSNKGVEIHSSNLKPHRKNIPMAVIKTMRPRMSIIQPSAQSSSMMSNDLVNHLQRLFTWNKVQLAVKIDDSSGNNESDLMKEFGETLGEAIAQAMHTKSGCGALTNYKQTIFFIVDRLASEDEMHKDENLIIKVSRVYKAHEREILVTAFVAWMIEAFLISFPLLSELQKEPSKVFDYIAGNNRFVRLYEQDKSVVNCETDKRSHEEMFNLDCTECEWYVKYFEKVHDHMLRERVTEFRTMSEMLNPSLWCDLLNVKNDKQTSTGFDQMQSLFRSGHCSTVRATNLNGKPAVIKYWNRLGTFRHMYELVNEGLLYSYIAAKHPQQDSIPSLLSLGFDAWFGFGLVMERVGSRVRNCKEYIALNGVPLTNEERHKLSHATLTELRKLHNLGIVHGDVALRNIQVVRKNSEEYTRIHGNNSDLDDWKVWWIDLGRGKLTKDPAIRLNEERACREMFILAAEK